MEEASVPASTTRRTEPVALIGGALGFIASRYMGANVLIPLAGIFVLLWLMKFAPARRPVRVVVAVLGGHLLWMIMAVLFAPTLLGNAILDIVVMSGLLVWLVARPSRAALVAVAIFEGLALALNVWSLLAQPVGSDAHRALCAHGALRIVVLVALVVAWKQVPRRKRAVGQPSGAV